MTSQLPSSAEHSDSEESPKVDRWARQTRILLVFMLLALAVGIFALLQIDTNSLLSLEQPKFLLLAILLQFTSLLLNSWNWQAILAMSGGAKISFHSSTVYSGINFVGKYIPGKFGGVVMRAWAQSRSDSSPESVIKASLIDQVAAAHSGVFLIAGLMAYYAEGTAVIAWVFLSVLVLVGLFFSGLGVRLASFILAKIPGVKDKLSALGTEFSLSYMKGFCRMIPVWLVTAAAIQSCAYAFAVEIEFTEILLITAMSFLAGFVVFILPAGIGAREGVLVFLLTPYCSLATAITIASLYRLLSISIDLAFGSYSLHRLRNPEVTPK